MTQRERVLSMLKDAGPKGVRSDRFFEANMPRAAARIQELKDAGEPISTEREGKYARYTYGIVELGGDGRPNPKQGPSTVAQTPQLSDPDQLFEEKKPTTPSHFDWDQAA